MKRTISLFVAAVLAAQVLWAQTLEDAKGYLRSQFKTKSAREILKKLYDANPKDPQIAYWYGQAMIMGEAPKEDVQSAKDIYQKALKDGLNDPYIWIGVAHTDLLQGGDINSAEQKFEQAITATTESKGKNKGKPNPAILNAIGRSNTLGRMADGSSKFGDVLYALDKLKQATTLDPNNTDNYVLESICYLKMGGENGGDAVKALQQALTIDPKSALAMVRMGKVYASQNNPDIFLKYYEDAIKANPTYPDSYIALFDYYKYKDVNKAKGYLDNFIATADKDPRYDFFMADYLFQAGKYQESLDKAKAIEAAVGENAILRINVLYAYDYDRLGDSVKAKTYLEKFFTTTSTDKIVPSDYELAVKVFSKFPGSETVAVGYLEKAIANETDKKVQLGYANQAADLLGKAKLYTDQAKWLQKVADLKGGWAEIDYYRIINAIYSAKDYTQTMAIGDKYIAAFPDKPQGYSFKVRAAKALDTTSNPGIAIDPLLQQNDFLTKDGLEKNKKAIVNNYFYIMSYYNDRAKDYAKSLEICDKILEVIPGDPEMLKIKEAIQGNISKPGKSNKPGSVQPGKSPK